MIKLSTSQKILLAFEFFVGLIGYALVWYGSNWIVTLGLFLAMWANNVMMDRKLNP